MDWQPSPRYRFALKNGMNGADCWGLQINLAVISPGLDTDGYFGPKTEQAVRAFQGKHGLTVDGVAGIITQRSIIMTISQPATDQFKLPQGLLKSIAENESGFAIGAYSRHPSDEGFDLGPYQQSFPPAVQNQGNFANAYSAKWMSNDTGHKVRMQKDEYRRAPKVKDDRTAWRLAVLYHNWPAAAENLAYKGSVYNDPVMDTKRQDWIVTASGGTMSTAQEWVAHYMDKATIYVTDWTA